MRITSFGAAFAVLLSAGVANAGDLPVVTTLRCTDNCPQHVAAKLLSDPFPTYHARFVRNNDEGVVVVSYTIGTDGRAKNIIVEEKAGTAEFVQSVKNYLDYARFQPATDDGKPAEENHVISYIFKFSGRPFQQAHGVVADEYKSAIKLDREGQTAAAIELLEKAFGQRNLDLYETTMVATALAQLEAKSGDYLSALYNIRIATIDGGADLDKAVREKAYRLRVELDAKAGDVGDALSSYDRLKDIAGTLAPDDPAAVLAAKLKELVAAPQPLWVSGSILSNEETPHWRHTLVRRSFGFADIKGKLDRFDLRCLSHAITSPVSVSARWTVPPSWSDCTIYVFGTPGSTFKFGEAKPATVAQKS